MNDLNLGPVELRKMSPLRSIRSLMHFKYMYIEIREQTITGHLCITIVS